ncbi:MAG: hypothetical protein R3B47_15885 [Bacteroidia bacterium]
MKKLLFLPLFVTSLLFAQNEYNSLFQQEFFFGNLPLCQNQNFMGTAPMLPWAEPSIPFSGTRRPRPDRESESVFRFSSLLCTQAIRLLFWRIRPKDQ